jgi:hypothetical protein
LYPWEYAGAGACVIVIDGGQTFGTMNRLTTHWKAKYDTG